MAQVIGSIPEFTQDAAPVEEVKEPLVEPVEETETPAPPAEKPEAEKPVEPSETDKAIDALKQERVKLLNEISDLRGTRRELKQSEITKVEKQLDELKDVSPEDVAVIDRVLRAKGYITKQESSQMHFEAVKNEELNRFLEKYPEYKPENDPKDHNWSLLQKEIALYRTPDDPRQIATLLERAHRSLPKVESPNIPARQRQLQVASAGAGGVQKSAQAPTKSLTEKQKEVYRNGGWSEAEITEIEKDL